MDRSRIAILIPALNEASTISRVVDGARIHGDVIVIDDGSTDTTAEIAAEHGAHVVSNTDTNGYDNAIEAGFAEADRLGYEGAITMDADGEHDPDVLPLYGAALIDEQIPLVVGCRKRPQRFAEAVMAWYFRRRFGIRDPLCGMKGYRLELYRENGGFDHVESIGTELMFNSIRRGHRFRELAVAGGVRQDTPRFGRTLRANYRIGRALVRLLRMERRAANV